MCVGKDVGAKTLEASPHTKRAVWTWGVHAGEGEEGSGMIWAKWVEQQQQGSSLTRIVSNDAPGFKPVQTNLVRTQEKHTCTVHKIKDAETKIDDNVNKYCRAHMAMIAFGCNLEDPRLGYPELKMQINSLQTLINPIIWLMCSGTMPLEIWNAGKKRLKFLHKNYEEQFKGSPKWRLFGPPLLEITAMSLVLTPLPTRLP
ncbi:hypothetical protein B0H19DRAFT_1085949 [Mycena capillaripes]|nr:hypothetical protein B0H19DRAFT_1085949 [Mycena capillaripes]